MSKQIWTHVYDKTTKDPATTTKKKYGGFFQSLTDAKAWVKKHGGTTRWLITDKQPFPKPESDAPSEPSSLVAGGSVDEPTWSGLFGIDPDYTDGRPVDEFIEENRQTDKMLDKALDAVRTHKAQGGPDAAPPAG